MSALLLGVFGRIEVRRRGAGPLLLAIAATVALLFWRGPTPTNASIGAWVFWSLAAAGFVLSFTTFDQWFRDRALRTLQHAAPVPPLGELLGRGAVIVARHLPLAAFAVAAGVGRAGPALWVGGAAVALAVVTQVVLATSLHIVVGKSLISGNSALKQWLSQGLGPPEAALLFYGPAGAFVLTLVHAVFVELGVRTWLLRGDASLLLGALGAGVVAAALLAREALSIHQASGAAVAARFEEFEIVPPWREDGLPRRLWGEGLRRWAGPALPIFLRDLRQLRRRHRVVPLLVGVSALVGGGLALSTPRAASAAVMALVALFLVPAASLAGELSRDRALPIPPAWERRSVLLLSLADQGPAALALLVGALAGGAAALLWPAVAVLALVVTALLPPAAGRAALLLAAIAIGGVA